MAQEETLNICECQWMLTDDLLPAYIWFHLINLMDLLPSNEVKQQQSREKDWKFGTFRKTACFHDNG